MHRSSNSFLELDLRSTERTFKISTIEAMMIIIKALYSLGTKTKTIKEEVNLDNGEIEMLTMQGVDNPKEVKTEIIKAVTTKTELLALLTIQCSRYVLSVINTI